MEQDYVSPISGLKTTGGENPIVLIPQPSDDPKQPLVRSFSLHS